MINVNDENTTGFILFVIIIDMDRFTEIWIYITDSLILRFCVSSESFHYILADFSTR